jgi:hypothetical protein
MSVEHREISGPNVHVPYNWSFPNRAARIAAGSYTSADLGKIARQEDDNTFWQLTGTTPSWRFFAGGAAVGLMHPAPQTYNGESIANWNDVVQGGFFQRQGASNAPEGSESWFFVTPMEHNASWAIQEAMGGVGTSPQNKYRRRKANNVWGAWRMYWDTGNTIVDGNGFIKEA